MLLYFAHPIDQVAASNVFQPRQGTTLRQEIKRIERSASLEGISMFRPGRAYDVNRVKLDNGEAEIADMDDLRVVDRINCTALTECDGLVALLIDGIPTLGVPAEIEAALGMNMPVLILCSVQLAANSVQIGNWHSRGAKVRMLIPLEGNAYPIRRWMPEPGNLTRLRFVDSPKLLWKSVHPAANPPTRAYAGDAGLDLGTVEDVELSHGVPVMLRTGVAAAVPDGWWGLMKGRSSSRVKLGLMIHDGVIDSGYRGELMIGVTLINQATSKLKIPAGTRLAQYILVPTYTGTVHQVDELPEHERGHNGYGSSGS